MRGIIYARYSSDNQTENSIEGQLRECKAFAENKGIVIVDSYIEACDILEPTRRNQVYQGFQGVGHFFGINITRPGLVSRLKNPT